MSTLEHDLKKIAGLAYIGMDSDSTSQLTDDVRAIMEFVEQLRVVNTTAVQPLLHPLDLNQRLREDAISEENQVNQLGKMAPMFVDDLYLVPKVIDQGK